jgi:hypothetical protein
MHYKMPRTETLNLTQSNFENSTSNVLRYKFTDMVTIKKAKINLVSMSFYNSFFNVSSSEFNNAEFKVRWIDEMEYTFTLDDGYYDYLQLSAIIAWNMERANLYMIKGNTKIFPFDLVPNSSGYGCTISVLYIPTSAGASELEYELPPEAEWTWPDSPITPQIIFPHALARLMGFQNKTNEDPRTLPATPQAEVYFKNNDNVPVISPVFSILIQCNMLTRGLGGTFPQIMGQVDVGAEFGGLVKHQAAYDRGLYIHPGKYPCVEFRMFNQNYWPLGRLFLDRELAMTVDITFEDD